MIIYADDTTLYSTLDVFGNNISKNLNLELTKVAEWLKLNKLSINIKKSKFMVFHMPQKQVNIPNIEIENIKIEFADEFNFLGLTIHKLLKWDSHINKIASKMVNIIGIMYRLNSSFTDFPLTKLPPETDFFLKKDPLSSPWAPYRV